MLLTMPVKTKTKQTPSKVNCNGLRGSFSILNTNSSSILITGNLKRMIWTLYSLITEKQSNQKLSKIALLF